MGAPVASLAERITMSVIQSNHFASCVAYIVRGCVDDDDVDSCLKSVEIVMRKLFSRTL